MTKQEVITMLEEVKKVYYSNLYSLMNNKKYNRHFYAYYYDYGQWLYIGEFFSVEYFLKYIKSEDYSHIFNMVFGKRVKLVYPMDNYYLEYEVVYLENPGRKGELQ